MAKRPAYLCHETRLQDLECDIGNMRIELAYIQLKLMEKPPLPWWKRFLGIDQ